MTPQTLVNELAASGDAEVGIPWGVLKRICEREGLTLPGDPDQCANCHGFGDHDPSCDLDRCGICGKHGNRCTCDAAYNRGVE